MLGIPVVTNVYYYNHLLSSFYKARSTCDFASLCVAVQNSVVVCIVVALMFKLLGYDVVNHTWYHGDAVS